jgi:pimeloyl-ACP methyl ester carboxylesterase
MVSLSCNDGSYSIWGARSLAADLQAVTIDGRRIEYYDIGQGPVVMLIHGANCDAADWSSVIEPLAARYRLIIPDGLVYPFGPWDLWLLLDELDISTVALVGHSKGAAKSVNMYRFRPSQVWALVSIDDELVGGMLRAWDLPNSRCPPHVRALHEKNDIELAKLDPTLIGSYPSDANISRLKLYFKTREQTPQQRAQGRPHPVAHEMSKPLSAKPEPIPRTINFIRCPLLVFNAGYGKAEASDPPEAGETWLGEPIQAEEYEYVVVRDSGHWIWLDQPQIFLEQILSFLARSSPVR